MAHATCDPHAGHFGGPEASKIDSQSRHSMARSRRTSGVCSSLWACLRCSTERRLGSERLVTMRR